MDHGIRFVLFMQGCSLKCKYCHNRDTWSLNGGLYTTVSELVENIKKYKTYFSNSGGGVTVTGGEPLLQPKFLIELFKVLKQEGIHTALDTSRYSTYKRWYSRIIKIYRFSIIRYKTY